MPNFLKFTVNRVWLFILAGLMWSGVGIMLCVLAYNWLAALHTSGTGWDELLGLGLALLVYRFGFVHIAQKNISRLYTFLEKASPFAFISVKSYLLVVFMMGLGMALRNSPLPKVDLSILYITIGAALFFSSLHYYPHMWTLASRPAGNTD